MSEPGGSRTRRAVVWWQGRRALLSPTTRFLMNVLLAVSLLSLVQAVVDWL